MTEGLWDRKHGPGRLGDHKCGMRDYGIPGV